MVGLFLWCRGLGTPTPPDAYNTHDMHDIHDLTGHSIIKPLFSQYSFWLHGLCLMFVLDVSVGSYCGG